MDDAAPHIDRDGQSAEAKPTPESQSPRGEVIAIGNIKGGVGKTTLTAQLAGLLHDRGQRVLAIDADPHGTLACWASGGPLADLVRHEPLRSVKSIGDWVGFAREARRNHDTVLIDLPGASDATLTTGFMIADRIIMPVGPMPGELHAADQTMKRLQLTRKVRNGQPGLWIVPNKIDHRLSMSATLSDWLNSLNAVITPAIGNRQAIAESAVNGSWLGNGRKEQKARDEIAAILACLETAREETESAVAA